MQIFSQLSLLLKEMLNYKMLCRHFRIPTIDVSGSVATLENHDNK
jgi:hypothetical protein